VAELAHDTATRPVVVPLTAAPALGTTAPPDAGGTLATVIELPFRATRRVGRVTGRAGRPGRKPLGRAVDVALAGAALVALSPAIAACAVAVRLSSRGPVLFRQERVGVDGRAFEVLKFRTMRVGASEDPHREQTLRELLEPEAEAGTSDGAFKPEHDPRITAVGHVLRRYSLDELPQLINVLRGDMAVVGPRPLLPWEVELHSAEHRRRALVPPGLTGLWQVSGRNLLSARQMLDLDVWYVDHRSWALDLRILGRTPATLLRGDGAR
jgi:lipopolysaccharide/colanic/teichoic acid biosynthesis glycosyltransferase